jgi:hypothetical protein
MVQTALQISTNWQIFPNNSMLYVEMNKVEVTGEIWHFSIVWRAVDCKVNSTSRHSIVVWYQR